MAAVIKYYFLKNKKGKTYVIAKNNKRYALKIQKKDGGNGN